MTPKSQNLVASRICALLQLPPPDEFSQDWANENALPKRIAELIDIYQEELADRDEKDQMMALILNSSNEALENGKLEQTTWLRVVGLLRSEKSQHARLIEHWLSLAVDAENRFALSEPLYSALHG